MHEPLGLLGTAVTGALARAKGCPLRHLKDEAGLRYVRRILHEYINDAAFRARLIDSMSFCGRHRQIMIDQRDNLGNAILLEATASQALGAVQRALERVDVRVTRRGSTPRSELMLSEITNIKACPACETEESSLLREGCEEVIRSCDHRYQGDKPDISILTKTVATVNVHCRTD